MISTDKLIPISYDSDRPTVSARDLHSFLEVKTDFCDWFPRMAEYGFTNGIDYSSFLRNRSDGKAGKPATDYQLTIDMAKELCMIQRTERGKKARRYFIQVENAWNDPEALMARALKMADAKIDRLESKIEDDAPKVLFANAVAASESPMLIGELAKVIKQNGVDIGEKRLFDWMRSHGYLINRRGTDYNAPTQKSMDMELFKVKETAITHGDGHVTVSRTTKVTGKGQQYFINKFLKRDD
ncbi:MAG TPA: phage antirepressor KilAC domain-containing protein [Caproicibacter sp.]|nr:phage antirepressor KilAC domain-containing protein [Caproicibacter sp.]